MTLPRYARSYDTNEATLRDLWRAMGGSWLRLVPEEEGTPDALLGFRGVDQLCEVKMPEEGLRPEQLFWHRRWRGRPVKVIRTGKDLEALAREMSG